MMDNFKLAKRWLKRDLRNTFPNTPPYAAILTALNALDAVEQMGDITEDRKIIDRLTEEYNNQLKLYEAEKDGKRKAAENRKKIVEMLGKILGLE